MNNGFSARFLCFVFLLCLVFPASVFAQAIVPVRVSERDDYARVVFGLTQESVYKIEQRENGTYRITFESNARADFSDADISGITNIFDVKVLSESPLTIEFSIPESSDVRDFKIGKRIILDVYNPQNPADLKKTVLAVETPVKPQKKPKKEDQSEARKAPLENEVRDQSAEEPVAAPPEIVFVPEKLAEFKKQKKQINDTSAELEDKRAEQPKLAPHKQKALNDAVKNEQHILSLLATNRVNVAVFSYLDQLWFVMDDNSPYLIPSLSSAQKKLFGGLRKKTLDGGSAYYFDLPNGVTLNMKGLGGGLDWKVVMGDKVKANSSVKPVRVDDENSNDVAGKFLWPIKGAGNPLVFTDEVTGQKIYTVPVDSASKGAGEPKAYVEFEVLHSPIGLSIISKVEDLEVMTTPHGIEISRPNGLSLVPTSKVDEAQLFIERKEMEIKESKAEKNKRQGEDDEAQALLKFKEWKMVETVPELQRHTTILLSGLREKSDARKVEDLLTLGKMHLAHGRGAEALGFFDFAAQELPSLEKSQEFLLLRGVARAIDWKNEAALQDFLRISSDDLEEAKYWKSYVLADLGDWEQAISVLPDHFRFLHDYPPEIVNRLALVLAEVNLRDGRVDQAGDLLKIVESNASDISDPLVAHLKYLRGEVYRQKGDSDRAKEIWGELTEDKDDLYRTKAGLALAVLLDQEEQIDTKEMIDRLERLRYAWRGDELEAQVKFWLGTSYFENKNFIKGLAIMREGAAIASGTVLASRITKEMAETFTQLYLSDDLKTVSALDALALYDQFSELTPVGSKGDKMVQMLAEHLVDSDLLRKAAELLEYQVDHRLSGEEKMRVAIRLAAIRLLDKDPQKAVNALGKAEKVLARISDKQERRKRAHEIALLRVRAYLQNKQFDTALSLVDKLPAGKDMHRLRADIAWQAGYWDEAADAFEKVLIDENLSVKRALTEEQASLILNRAIALSLNNDFIALANMREKYLPMMAKVGNKANQFEVITRPRGRSTLADRETLMSAVSEVDLFRDFLESYKQEQK